MRNELIKINSNLKKADSFYTGGGVNIINKEKNNIVFLKFI